MGITENYLNVRHETEKINPRCRLIVVTKNRSPVEINELIKAGQKDFGENRLQELESKIGSVKGAVWHFVGHLQGNKARRAVQLCESIHSVDSIKLAKKIDAAAKGLGKKQKIFVEVNVSGESSKYGVKPGELKDFLEELKALENIEVLGLMTIAPLMEAEKTRPYFQALKKLANENNLKELSMGMSNDYRIAMREGATVVRVGTAVFG